MPISVIHNWKAEFNVYLPDDHQRQNRSDEVRPRCFHIYSINESTTTQNRSKEVLEWSKSGGVLLIGYEMYRSLTLITSNNYDGEEKDSFQAKVRIALLEPDLSVCDEGHRIKTLHANTSLALKQIRTKRKIVLTGYPIQNNLLEYWCMVDFVKPNYLGTISAFSENFKIPIENGQFTDSTPQNVELMKERVYLLHSLLLQIVQRRSNDLLFSSIPPKEEYVLTLRMTDIQRSLYESFINLNGSLNPLKAFAACCKIMNHPDVLYNFLKKRCTDFEDEDELKLKSDTNWAEEIMNNYIPDLIENSPKMEIFFCILKESLTLGDRILLFSQSLSTLNLIEKFLQSNTKMKWMKNVNYFRKFTLF